MAESQEPSNSSCRDSRETLEVDRTVTPRTYYNIMYKYTFVTADSLDTCWHCSMAVLCGPRPRA